MAGVLGSNKRISKILTVKISTYFSHITPSVMFRAKEDFSDPERGRLYLRVTNASMKRLFRAIDNARMSGKIVEPNVIIWTREL